MRIIIGSDGGWKRGRRINEMITINTNTTIND